MKNFLLKSFITSKQITLSLGFILICIIAFIALSSRFSLPGGIRAYSVLTGSMEPVIQTGSLILTQSPTSVSDIKQNMVITFEEPGYENKFITHRVARTLDSSPGVFFKTRGDANSIEDPWTISYGHIKGIYVMHFPYLGRLLEFIRSPLGIALFIILPVTLIAVEEIKNIINTLADIKVEKSRRKKEKEGIDPKHFVWIILLPLICLSVNQTRALFISNNLILAQNSISVALPSPSPSDTPSPSQTPGPSQTPEPSSTPVPSQTPQPSASPSPSPTGGTVIVIEGNGEGSQNEADIENEESCEINQENNTEVEININSSSDSGGDESSGNTGGNSNVNSGDSSSTANVSISGESNSSNNCP